MKTSRTKFWKFERRVRLSSGSSKTTKEGGEVLGYWRGAARPVYIHTWTLTMQVRGERMKILGHRIISDQWISRRCRGHGGKPLEYMIRA